MHCTRKQTGHFGPHAVPGQVYNNTFIIRTIDESCAVQQTFYVIQRFHILFISKPWPTLLQDYPHWACYIIISLETAAGFCSCPAFRRAPHANRYSPTKPVSPLPLIWQVDFEREIELNGARSMDRVVQRPEHCSLENEILNNFYTTHTHFYCSIVLCVSKSRDPLFSAIEI